MHDDLWETNKLLKQVELFLRNKQVSFIYSNLWIQNENLKRKLYWKKDLPSGIIYKKIIKEYCIGIITVMIKRNILSKKNAFNPKYMVLLVILIYSLLAKKKINIWLFKHHWLLIESMERIYPSE